MAFEFVLLISKNHVMFSENSDSKPASFKWLKMTQNKKRQLKQAKTTNLFLVIPKYLYSCYSSLESKRLRSSILSYSSAQTEMYIKYCQKAEIYLGVFYLVLFCPFSNAQRQT